MRRVCTGALVLYERTFRLTCQKIRRSRPWLGEGRYKCGAHDAAGHGGRHVRGRGLHSSTFRLNVRAFRVVGGALRDCLQGVLRR
jgi:hypothetical protein